MGGSERNAGVNGFCLAPDLGLDFERLANPTRDMKVQRCGGGGDVFGPLRLELLFQLGIAGFPDLVTRLGGVRRHGTSSEEESVALHAKQKSPRLFFSIGSPVDDHPVARAQGNERVFQFHPVGACAGDPAGEGSSLFSKPGVNQLLVVDSVEPAGEESPAKGHFEPVFIFH